MAELMMTTYTDTMIPNRSMHMMISGRPVSLYF